MKKHTGSQHQYLFDIRPESKTDNRRKQKDDFVFDIMDALKSPILTFSQQWADIIPKRMLEQVPLARMLSLMKTEELATYVECCIYLYTRTHEAPMDSDWTNIYLHVSCQSLADCFGEDHWDKMNAPKVLNDWLERKLLGLRRHIFNKRREILKQRLKIEEKSQPIADARAESASPKQPKIQQASFDF